MTAQSGFILSHLDVYSVAKCIITVKFLISKFARFNSMTTKRKASRCVCDVRTIALCVLCIRTMRPNLAVQWFHQVNYYLSRSNWAFHGYRQNCWRMKMAQYMQKKSRYSRTLKPKKCWQHTVFASWMLPMQQHFSVRVIVFYSRLNLTLSLPFHFSLALKSMNFLITVGSVRCHHIETKTKVMVDKLLVVVKWIEICAKRVFHWLESMRAETRSNSVRLILNLGQKLVCPRAISKNKVFLLCHQTFYFEVGFFMYTHIHTRISSWLSACLFVPKRELSYGNSKATFPSCVRRILLFCQTNYG